MTLIAQCRLRLRVIIRRSKPRDRRLQQLKLNPSPGETSDVLIPRLGESLRRPWEIAEQMIRLVGIR